MWEKEETVSAGAEEVKEAAGAGCWRLAEVCHTEQKLLRRCFSGGPGSSQLNLLHQRRTKAASPNSSSVHLPSAWG